MINLVFSSPHKPLRCCAVRPVEGLGDEDVDGGNVHGRVQEELPDESGKGGKGHVQAIHQVWNDEVPELQELLRDCGGHEASQESQTPKERARFKGVQKIPPGEDVRRDEEETHQFVPLEKFLPHIKGEMAVISQEVLVDKGEFPHQEQRDAGDQEEKQRLLFESLQEAEDAVVTQRDGEREEEGEGEEVEELGEVEAGLVARPVANHDPIIERHKHQEANADQRVRPGHQQHRLHVIG